MSTTQRGPVRSRQDYTGSLRLQSQICGQDLRKAQERTGEVCRTAPQVQRNRLSADSEAGHHRPSRITLLLGLEFRVVFLPPDTSQHPDVS